MQLLCTVKADSKNIVRLFISSSGNCFQKRPGTYIMQFVCCYLHEIRRNDVAILNANFDNKEDYIVKYG